jgi:DNA-binding beta-propeller fold protein YncE
MRASQRAAVLLLSLAACGGETEQPLVPPPPPVLSAAPVVETRPSASPPKVEPGASAVAPAPAPPAQLSSKAIPLPGVTPPASLDYLACDRTRGRVWVPVGNTGSADVLDAAKGTFTRVDGFKSGEREFRGQRRTVGPSAATVGDGTVYVGNRFTSEVCPVDASTLKLGKCLRLPSATDGVAYVPSTKEVWVTTPRDNSIVVLDASHPRDPKLKVTIKLDGAPEGYAADDSRGVFYTNLEDKDGTVAIDLKTHQPKATWKPGCGEEGPRGVATDGQRGFVFVACTDHVVVLDAGHDGAILGKLDTGAGVDNIDWLPDHRLLYVGAAKAARLTIATFDDKGQPSILATGASVDGARNPVADATGNAYLADPRNGRILVFPFAAP